MNYQQFQEQIVRLESEFGRKFGEEKTKLLWKQIAGFGPGWFKNCVDGKICYSRQMPLPCDFDEEISRERERLAREEKERGSQNFDDASTYGLEEISFLISENIRNIKGGMSPEEFDSFLSMQSRNFYKCQRCMDTNVYFHKAVGGNFICDHTQNDAKHQTCKAT